MIKSGAKIFVQVLLLNFCAAFLFAQHAGELLGVKMKPEVQAVIKEIEQKTGNKIYAEFVREDNYQLGSGFISEDRVPVVLIDFALENTPEKLEAVIVHELLHLRLVVNNYPIFLFSPAVQAAKGRAIDVEQGNANDLKNMIEHRLFKPEMEKLGLYQRIDLAGDAARQAKKMKGQADGQTEVINYVRAILEYHDARDISAVEKAYQANGWRRALQTGREIADIIDRAGLQTPKDVETIFLKCLLKLYPPPNSAFTFRLTVDSQNKNFRRIIISVGRIARKRN